MKTNCGRAMSLSITAMVGFGSVWPLGCASKAPARSDRQLITWQDVAREPVGPVEDSFRRVSTTATEGVFPASISVCRVEIEESDAGFRQLKLAMKPPHDVLPWNGAFDPIRAVAQAFPLAPINLQGSLPSVQAMIDASADLDADVLLLYGRPNRLSDFEAEVLGAVYDVRRGQLLAVVHARAHAPDPDEVELPANKVEGDPSYFDPEFLAERRFESSTLSCLLELRKHDRPMTIPPPEGWQKPRDREQVEWIRVPEGF